MSLPSDTELLGPSGAVTRLPSLGSPELSTDYLARLKEIIEAMLGRRGGNDWDRVVTFRDLHTMGLQGGAGGGGMVFNMAGAAEIDTGAPGFQQFIGRVSDEIMRSAAFKVLKTRIGSAESNAHLPDEIRRQLSLGLQQVARERAADIETVEAKIQTTALSMASRLTEITAALDQTAAGVRQFDTAYADRTQAIALKVTQLAASVASGPGIEIEERLEAIASEIDGLQGQWSIKIQTNDPANPVIAGIALAVESPIAGAGTSSLIFMAEKFGFVTNSGNVMPFSIVGSQITFNGNVRINGQLVIGPTGLQAGFEAPGTKNSELAPAISAAATSVFSPKLVWEFRNTLDGWTNGSVGAATLAPGADAVTVNSSGADPIIYSPGLAILGATYDKVRMRVKRKAGTTWDGQVFYWNERHTDHGNYKIVVPDTTKLNEWTILEWDMSKTADNDWGTSTVTRLRVDLGASASDTFEIDWIAIGKYAPPDIRDLGFAGDLNATSDITLVPDWMLIQGNTLIKSPAQGAGWNAQAYSKNSFTGGAYATAVAHDTTSVLMFGLNDDPLGNASYDTIDFAMYLDAGTANAWRNGGAAGNFGAYVAGDVFSVVYDGVKVLWMKNGAVLKTEVATITYPIFFDSSFNTSGAQLDGVRFGPMSSSAWSNVGGTGKPQDNATVGAPAGTPVAGTLAETVVANAAQGPTAYALADAAYNEAFARLRKDAADILTGPIAVQASGAILCGPLTVDAAGYRSGGYGVGISARGMVAYNPAGVMTFQLDFSGGNPYFAGQLSAAYGTFGAVSIAPGGKLTVGVASNFGDEGVFLGYVGSTVKFSIVTGSSKLLYDPTAGTPLQIINAALNNPTLDTFSCAAMTGMNGSGPNGSRGYGSRTATVTGGKAPYTYIWSYTAIDSAGPVTLGGVDTATVGVTGTATGQTNTGRVVCTITDANNRTITASFSLNQAHGAA